MSSKTIQSHLGVGASHNMMGARLSMSSFRENSKSPLPGFRSKSPLMEEMDEKIRKLSMK